MPSDHRKPQAASAGRKLYWEPFFHQGVQVDLSHLEPQEISCPTPDEQVRRVRVIYSPHVFTRGVLASDERRPTCFDQRVYCPDRYLDSKGLPAIVSGLPEAKVYQTWERRNYLHLSFDAEGERDPYHLFFEVEKKGGKRNKHVQLRVESAYRMRTSSYTPPARPNSIRFSVLVQNVFMGRDIKFSPR